MAVNDINEEAQEFDCKKRRLELSVVMGMQPKGERGLYIRILAVRVNITVIDRNKYGVLNTQFKVSITM